MSGNPEWSRLWDVVRAKPEDFNSWEQLIRIVDAVETIPPSSIEHVTNLELVYDQFLAKFPLCFGYWKKYADWEGKLNGVQGAEKTFERGLAAIHNSIDLWNQYLDFKMTHSVDNEEIENLFERASVCVGQDFLAHPFWDKYIDFVENKLVDTQKLLRLMDRIVVIPMHQYARYYEKWRSLRSSRKPSEVVSEQDLKLIYAKIQEEKNELPEGDALEAALKEKIEAHGVSVYKKTQEGTNKRWVYEAEIKRPYFHVRPLDRPQLQNWNRYLDFEEETSDANRIRILYERCLVPCAQYEEFWLRYGQWLMKNDLIEEAQNAYSRAVYTFLRSDKIHTKLALALILEEEERMDEAKSIYTSILEVSPSHIETAVRYFHFERRQNPDSLKDIISQYINSEHFDQLAKIHFIAQYIKHLRQNGQDELARNTFETHAAQFTNIRQFWIHYINFELTFYDQKSNSRIVNVFENARKSLTTEEDQKTVNSRFREYLLERSNNVHLLNRTPPNSVTQFLPENDTQPFLKRPLEIEDSSFVKQPRYDAYYGQQIQPQVPNISGNYYNQ